MKKVYCDRCGKEVEQNNNIILRRKNDENNPFKADIEEYFDICPKCRESFFGWLNSHFKDAPALAPAPAKEEKEEKTGGKTKLYLYGFWVKMDTLCDYFEKSRQRLGEILKSMESEITRRKQVRSGRWWYEYKLTRPQVEKIKEKISNQKGASKK